jgi:multidrug efflux pump subunit AcrA (membrane-fusion protein)
MKRKAFALFRWILVPIALLAIAIILWQVVVRVTRPLVTVTTIVEAPVVQAFYATGTLLPEREYPIKANNPGLLTEVLVDKGDHVKKDQPLAIVIEDSVQYRFEQARAERDQQAKLADDKTSPVLQEYDARISATQDLLDIALREQKRIAQIMEQTAGGEAELNRATERVKMTWADLQGLKSQRQERKLALDKNLEVADAALRIAQWNLDRQTIRSPTDGTVLDRPATVGTRLAVNDHIMQVAEVGPEQLIMRAAVDEEDKTFVRPGQTVRMVLYAFENRSFTGTVKKIYDKADADRRTFEIDVAMIEKDPAYSAGMTGELAFIISEKEKTTVIPTQAVQSNEVWLVRDGALVKADLRLGLASIDRTEVLSGLSKEDLVVISPISTLKEGQRVRTIVVDPTGAANLNKPKQEQTFTRFN